VLPTDHARGVPVAPHEPSAANPCRAAASNRPAPTAQSWPTRSSCAAPSSQVRLNLEPGQKATRKLLAKYGDRFVCVRCRYDRARRKRFKTVEIIADERDWEPSRLRHFADDEIAASASTSRRWQSASG